MRRAAISVASNIAEGAAKDTIKEFIRYLHTARGSLSELDTQAVICKELGYLSAKALDLLDEEFERESRLITGLIKFMRKTR